MVEPAAAAPARITDFLASVKHLAEGFSKHGYIVLKLQRDDTDKIAAAQTVLQDLTQTCLPPSYTSLQPYKTFPGRNMYLYQLNQDESHLPASWSHSAAQAFKVFQRVGAELLAVVSNLPWLNIKTTAFHSILDDPDLAPGQVSSSALEAMQYLNTGQASSGCLSHVDKGLLTIITADTDGLEVFSPEEHTFKHLTILSGHVAILPGYTLERATCGLIKAALHQVTLSGTAQRKTLAFKLRASPSAVLNLYPDLPPSVKLTIEPRYARPISVAELMREFHQTHESINASPKAALDYESGSSSSAPSEYFSYDSNNGQALEGSLDASPEEIPIHVATADEQVLTFWQASSSTFEELAWKIRQSLRVVPERQRLLIAGRQVDMSQTLQDYGVQADCFIDLRLYSDRHQARAGTRRSPKLERHSHAAILKASQGREGEAMPIIVKMLTGKIVHVPAQPTWVVWRLANYITQHGGVPAASQRFLLNGCEMDKRDLLVFYGAEKDCTVYWILKLRGD